MQFQPGNELWKRRENIGRPATYETPEAIWEAACAYFEWCLANPLIEAAKVTYEGEGKTFDVNKMRAMTQQGLCLHMGISAQTWSAYKKKPDFLEITSAVESVIFEQKFTGAAAGLLNASIVARELGLADKKHHTGAIAIMEKDDFDL